MPAAKLLYQTILAMPPSDTLVINAAAHPLLSELARQCPRCDIQQHFKPEYRAIECLGLSPISEIVDDSHCYARVLLLPGKNKQQTHAWLAEAMNRLRENGKIIVACANKHGAKSYESALKQLAGNLTSRSRSKCRIVSAQRSIDLDNKLASQWMDAGKSRRIDAHGLITQPGLFSWDRPNTGSALLLEQLPELSGAGMDLCCGYGLLSTHNLRRSTDIKQIHLVEADRLALECARQNTASWPGITQYHWTDATSEILPAKLDWIVCPPLSQRS